MQLFICKKKQTKICSEPVKEILREFIYRGLANFFGIWVNRQTPVSGLFLSEAEQSVRIYLSRGWEYIVCWYVKLNKIIRL